VSNADPAARAEAQIAAALAPLIDEGEAAVLGRLPLLSNQERAVWALTGRGMRPKAVAWELAISPKTVETHLARLRAKLAGGDPADLDPGDLAFLARLWVRAGGGGVEE
jgi:DNA-binding CsgD family transcriptional regulator